MQLVSAGFLCLFAAAAMTLYISQNFAQASISGTSYQANMKVWTYSYE